MKKRLAHLAVLLLALSLPTLIGCDSANPVAPPGTVLTMTASPTLIGLDGSSTITITGFRPDGNPLNPGTQITLTTDLGVLTPGIAQADQNGRATATLAGDGRVGVANVTATLPGSDATASVAVQIGQTGDTQPQLVIDANPTVIAVSQTSLVSLLARAADNTPLGAGNRIRLTADLGILVAEGGDANDEQISEAVTDQNGEAFVTYVAGTRGGNGEVSAILGSSEEVSVTITIRDAIDSLFLSASQQTVQRTDAGETILFTATLQDAQGEPVTGTIVNFNSQRGTFDDNAVPSNSQGQAQATLTVRGDDVQDIPENGTFTVTATATSEGNTRSDSVTITVLGAP